MILFSDRGCAFAHRVLALIKHLGLDVDRRESLVGDKPAGLERFSASRAVPLLVHGGLVLTESRVMLEHLAEAHRFAEAWPRSLPSRTRHRHAMAMVDAWLGAALFGHRELSGARLHDLLDTLQAAADAPSRPNLLAFHVAPIWLRYRLLRPDADVTRAIEARPALCGWLDAAVQLPAVQDTAPHPSTYAEDLQRAKAAGLVPAHLTWSTP